MKRLVPLAVGAMWLLNAHAGEPDAARELGITEYEAGHYAVAVQHLRRAAELGDPRAPEILALMYRYGERLYGEQIRADPAEAAHWTALAVDRRFPRIAAAVAPAR